MAHRPAYNLPTAFKVDASSTNIPTAYATSAGSKFGTGLSDKEYSHMMVINETSSRIKVAVFSDASTAPATGAGVYIPANSSQSFDDYSVFDVCYVKSDSGSAITTGTVEINFW